MDIPRPTDREAPVAAEAPAGLTGPVVLPVGGPTSTAWREEALIRATKLKALRVWFDRADPTRANAPRLSAAQDLLDTAESIARHRGRPFGFLSAAPLERAMRNLDAAEADLLAVAPDSVLVEQVPGLVNQVRRHLEVDDPLRRELEDLAGRLGAARGPAGTSEIAALTQQERNAVVLAMRAAQAAAMREQLRIRSFRAVLMVTTALVTLIAIGIAVTGLVHPALVPLCFVPEHSGQSMVVCPTAQSPPVPSGQLAAEVDAVVGRTARPFDLSVVELVGLVAAAVAAAATLRGARGSSEAYGLPVALATLKLPMGAVTAFLGLLLMRGQFVPGLSALDTSAQILAWALIFGYAQQLVTRLVDQQAQTVLNMAGDREVAGRRVSSKAVKQLERILADAVDQSIHKALVPPRLANVEGRLSAAWVKDGATWSLEAIVRTGHASWSDERDGESRPFRLVGGEPKAATQLEVSVDLPGHRVDVGERALMIETDGGSHTWTCRVEPTVTTPQEAWISISTYGRFLQAVATVG